MMLRLSFVAAVVLLAPAVAMADKPLRCLNVQLLNEPFAQWRLMGSATAFEAIGDDVFLIHSRSNTARAWPYLILADCKSVHQYTFNVDRMRETYRNAVENEFREAGASAADGFLEVLATHFEGGHIGSAASNCGCLLENLQ